MSSIARADGSRARDEQIMSAKKKLKSFRARQAQMSRSQTHSASSAAALSSAKSAVDVAVPLMAELDLQSFESSRRHSRTASRSGHGRGHSRAGSISISAQALASQAVAHSQSASAGAKSSATFEASNGHQRSHSRSISRSLNSRSRPNSALLGGRMEAPALLAVEHPAGVSPLGDWKDVSETPSKSALVAGQPEQMADVSILFTRSPGPSRERHSIASSPAMSTLKHEHRQSRHARRTSVSTKRESMEIMGGLGLGVAVSQSSDSIASSRRRSSRMSGLPSASVLFGVPDTGVPDTNATTTNPSWDWRSAYASTDASEEKENAEGRLTALEKLEGRLQPAATVTPSSSFGDLASQSQNRHSRRLSGHQRQSSVQLPSFDDMHGSEGMDRRASTQLLQSNEDTTSDSASTSSRDAWRSSLNLPASSSMGHPPKSPTSALTLVTSKRPESMIVQSETAHPEGLGTLMEEEEEEESLSPIRERPSIDMPLDGSSSLDEDLRKERRRAEEEVIKRNRRASLTPRPLKLKSRPASLYLAPSLGSGMAASQSLPTLMQSNLASPSTSSPSASMLDQDKTPRLANDVALPAEASTPRHDAQHAGDSPSMVKSWSFANAQQKLISQSTAASAVTDDVGGVTPQPEIMRAYRTSMVFSPPTSSMPTMSPAQPRERQGMRTLRLGSHQSSLASLSSVAESSSSSDSIGPSLASDRRRSIIRADSVSVNSSQEELGNGLPSTATARTARRSSIHYKPSVQHGASDSFGGHHATPSLASLGGVALAVHDELKAKASRDAALLESTKEQLERLQRELIVESERNSHELAELKHSAATDRSVLSARVTELDARVAELQRSLDDVERVKQRLQSDFDEAQRKTSELEQQLREKAEVMEDLEAERDVLRDDVEGWRSRCQDSEKYLRSERAKLDDQRKLKNAAKARIQQLASLLEEHGIEVPADEVNVAQALDEAQLDVSSVLRSPALGSGSPVVGVSGGYFSQAAADPPPMTIKLLADMRQQIFNLAGSLEHERSEHLKARDELARLREDQLQRSQSWTSASFADTSLAADESREVHREEPSVQAPPQDKRRTNSGNSIVGKNKRHVFAYDSSMGSFGQSTTSLGSASMSQTTDDATTDDEGSHSSPQSKTACSLEADAAGLGLGVGTGILQTLDEVEEASESGMEDVSTAGVSEEDRQPLEMETADAGWSDIEAGVRPSVDVSESSFGERQFEDAVSPMPPNSEKFSSPLQSPNPSTAGVEGHFSLSHGFRSTGSSLESNDGPTTPPLDHSQHQFLGNGGDDASTVSSRSPSPRPEFIPDWNFEMAVRRSRPSQSRKNDAVEDFFGIMHEGSLPPLSSSQEAIDMPPICLDARGQAAITTRTTTRVASSISRRPPVARSAYTRESFSESSGSPYGSFQARGATEHSSFSATSTAAAFGSRALSRMSLQGLTNAFSGLSGYLTNQSGAAVTAAAAATKMCGPGEMPEPDSVHASLSWTAQRRALDDEPRWYPDAANQRLVTPLKAREMVSTTSSVESMTPKRIAARPFIDPASIPPPMATPIWQLDFSRASMGGPIFSL